jgi:hypothetical protein
VRAERGALEGARAEIEAIAEEFAEAAPPIVEAALRRRLEALLRARADHLDGLAPDAVEAMRRAAGDAIGEGAERMRRRLADRDVWLSPRVVPGGNPPPARAWSALLPEWLAGALRRLAPAEDGPAVGALDDAGNRVWVAVLAAAQPLDPVLAEFGVRPREAPDLGGGHYGLRPGSAAELDPSGTLEGMWRRYRSAYERYARARGGRV